MGKTDIIDLTPETIGRYGVCGYKNAGKHVELRKKIDWFAPYYPKGLRIKALLADGTYQGMIEYIPGEYAHRPVDAEGYLFIHCIFLGFKKEYKGKGLGSTLIEACLEDAENREGKGIAVVTRKGSFMADKRVFLKKGFEVVDKAKPDFELLVKKLDTAAADPRFKPDMTAGLERYGTGLTVLRSPQ